MCEKGREERRGEGKGGRGVGANAKWKSKGGARGRNVKERKEVEMNKKGRAYKTGR